MQKNKYFLRFKINNYIPYSRVKDLNKSQEVRDEQISGPMIDEKYKTNSVPESVSVTESDDVNKEEDDAKEKSPEDLEETFDHY